MKTLYKICFALTIAFGLFGSTLAQTEREKGINLYLEGSYEKAVKALQKAIEKDAENREAHLFLGMALVKLKKEKEAVRIFRKVRKLKAVSPNDKEETVKIIFNPGAKYTDAARQKQIQGLVLGGGRIRCRRKDKFYFSVSKIARRLNRKCCRSVR